MATVQFDFLSMAAQRIMHVSGFIPCDSPYGQSFQPPYKTLYLLTGMADNADRVVLDSNLKKYSDTTGIAVFVMDGNNTFYVDSNPINRFSTLVGEELVTITRKAFPLSEKREDTYLGGMSMGGFGAFYNGMRYAERFSKVVMLAPAFDIYDIKLPGTDLPLLPVEFLDPLFGSKDRYDAEFNYKAAYEKAVESGKEIPALFMGLGNTDNVVEGGVKGLCEYMKEKHVDIEYHVVNGYHDFVFMENIYPPMFDFLKK